MSQHKTLLSVLLLLLLGFIWGSGYTLAKFAMTNGVPPLGYAFWQSIGPALLLSATCVMRRETLCFRVAYWPFYAVCGLLGIAIPNTCMYFSASHVPAGLLAVLVNTVPLILYPLALLTGQERFDITRVLAILLGMTGITLIIAPSFNGLLSGWTVAILICPLAFALCSLYINARQPAPLNALQTASGMLLAASLFITPFIIQQQDFYSLAPPFSAVKLVIILEILLSSFGYLLFFKLIRLAGPVFYSLTGGVVTLTGLFWGFLVFGEIPSQLQRVAIICVISALFLISLRQSRLPGKGDDKPISTTI